MSKIEVVCDHCGDTSEKYEDRVGENTFCNEDCWRSWQSDQAVEKPCSQCGDVVSRDPSKARDSEKFFCDTSCHGEWKSENLVGEDARNYISLDIECHQCGEALQRAPSTVENKDRVFCDESCEGQWRSVAQSGSDNPMWDGGKEEVECHFCEESIKMWPSHIEKNDRHFCSPECHHTWISEHLSKEGVSDKYGDTYYKFRKQVLKRDEHECQICGMSRDEHYDKYGQDIHCHHIIPIRLFEDPDNGNYDENGLALCLRCNNAQKGYDPIVVDPDVGNLSETVKQSPI